MSVAHITITAVSDEGDTVIIWGRPDDAPDGTEPTGYAFQTKGDHDTVAHAERASRLTAGVEAVIEYTAVVDGWNVGRGLSAS
jgi:hypothetical protein